MGHFARTQSDATWTNGGAGGYVTLLTDWESLFEKVFKSLNGDHGGTWVPSSPIIFDTEGLLVSVASTLDYGGTLTTTNGARFVLAPGMWPELGEEHVLRERDIEQPIESRLSTPQYHWCDAPDYPGSIQSLACTINGASGLEQPKCHIPLRVHDGARLSSLTLTFRVPAPRERPPVGMPRLRVIRVDKDGAISPMKSVAGGADEEGYVAFPQAKTGAEWYADGETQTFEYECDQNHTIDTSLYHYVAQLIEEVGSIVPLESAKCDPVVLRERKAVVYAVFTTNQAISGLSGGLVAGDWVLLTAQTFPSQNGIWVVDAGNWVRRYDLTVPADFAPSFLVPDRGTSKMWECVSPVVGQSIVIADDPGGTPISFQLRVPRGNVYHSMLCHFDSIADMRPQ